MTAAPARLELDTPHGLARAHLHPVEPAVAALVLCLGAGGGIASPVVHHS